MKNSKYYLNKKYDNNFLKNWIVGKKFKTCYKFYKYNQN